MRRRHVPASTAAAIAGFGLLLLLAGPAWRATAQPRSKPSAPRPKPPARLLTGADLAAIRRGGTVTLAPGVYELRQPVEIKGVRGLALVGHGVTLRAHGFGALSLTDCHDFRLVGLTFDGGRGGERAGKWDKPTLRITGCSRFLLDGLAFRDASGDHLYVAGGSHDGHVTDCTFTDAWRNAISVINAQRLRIEANVIDTVRGDVLGAGIDIEGNAEDPIGSNHDITVASNRFLNCAESGVRITNGREPYRIDVIDNTFENCPSGVLVGGRDCRVRGNVFRDATRPGGAIGKEVRAQVYLNGTLEGGLTEVVGNRFERLDGMGAVNVHTTWRGPVVIADNVIAKVKGEGVNAITVYSADATVRGNVIADVEAGLGIAIAPGATDATVTGNVMRRGGRTGILAEAAGAVLTGNTLIGFGDVQARKETAGDAVIEANVIAAGKGGK